MPQIFSFYYSIPYLIASLFLITLTYLEFKFNSNDRLKKRIRIITMLFLLCFFGFRGFVAWDWYHYYDLFVNLSKINLDELFLFFKVDTLEPFFLILMSSVKIFTDNWYIFLFVNTLIDLILLDFVIKKYSTNYAFSALLYFSLNIALPIDLLRNIKAILIFLLALESIFKRNIKKFTLFIIIGLFFHRSMLLFLPFYFIGNIRVNRRHLIFIFLTINIIYFSNIGLAHYLGEKISQLLGGAFELRFAIYKSISGYSTARGFTIGYFVRIFTFILIYSKLYKLRSASQYSNLFINMYLIYFIVSLGFYDFIVFVERVEILFGIALWFIWPILLETFNRPFNKKLVLVCVFLFCLLRTYKQTNNILYEYENIFTGVSTYNERINSHYVYRDNILKNR